MWKSNHSYFENENCISSSISNGLFPSILEQSSWSENNSILGTCCQLGLCGCGVGRHIKPPEMISDNMTAVMCVFSIGHEICMDGSTPQLYLLFACHATNEPLYNYINSRDGERGTGTSQRRRMKLHHSNLMLNFYDAYIFEVTFIKGNHLKQFAFDHFDTLWFQIGLQLQL